MQSIQTVKSAPPETGMNALSYCMLMLEKVELPQRGFYFDHMAAAIEPESVALGRAVLDEIEAIEGLALDRLAPPAIAHYTLLCARISREIYAGIAHPHAESAARLLDQMRAGTNKPLHGGREVWSPAPPGPRPAPR